MITKRGDAITRLILLLVICVLGLGTAAAKAISQPIYDEHADARQQIAEAISQATKAGRNIVLIFGANW